MIRTKPSTVAAPTVLITYMMTLRNRTVMSSEGIFEIYTSSLEVGGASKGQRLTLRWAQRIESE